MQYTVEIRGDDYDFENDCWDGRGLELLEERRFDTLNDALEFCKAITPLQAMKYEADGGYNGLSVCAYELTSDCGGIVASHDWIGMCYVGTRFDFEYGVIEDFCAHVECGVADTPIEAMAECLNIEREFGGTAIGTWRYNERYDEWRANSDNNHTWYMRKVL